MSGLFNQHHMLNGHLLGTGGSHLGGSVFPLLNPLGEPFDFLLLLFVILFLLLQIFFLLTHKSRVISVVPLDMMVFNLIGHINDSVQEQTVMGYNDHGFVVFF